MYLTLNPTDFDGRIKSMIKPLLWQSIGHIITYEFTLAPIGLVGRIKHMFKFLLFLSTGHTIALVLLDDVH